MSASAALLDSTLPDTRERIVVTAERLFRDIGYQKTTVADIAKVLKMSPANVYRFFDSKRAINEAVAERLMGEVEAALVDIAEGPGSSSERLRRLIATCHHMNAERYTANQKMHEMVEAAMIESWDVCHRHVERVTALFARVIAGGQRSGEFAVGDPERAALAVKCAMIRFFHPFLIVQCANEPGATLEEMTEFALRGIGCRPAG